jgi:hypothetical protein
MRSYSGSAPESLHKHFPAWAGNEIRRIGLCVINDPMHRRFKLFAVFLFPAFFALIALSCRKASVTGATDRLALAYQPDNTIKLNQAVTIYDSTALNDSLKYADPPGNRVYHWIISPTDDSALISGPSYTRGLAVIIFNRQGSYQVTAEIDDSSGQHLIGHTKPYTINVTADTLYRTLPLQTNDQLTLTRINYLDNNTASYATGMQFTLSTTDQYDNYPELTQLDFITNYGNNGSSFVFSDSVYLNSFPYAWTNDAPAQVTGEAISLSGFAPGVTESLGITWLNQTYTGSITETAPFQFTYNWPANIPVKLITSP